MRVHCLFVGSDSKLESNFFGCGALIRPLEGIEEVEVDVVQNSVVLMLKDRFGIWKAGESSTAPFTLPEMNIDFVTHAFGLRKSQMNGSGHNW